MFSSNTFLYSSVSGASCPQPRGLLGSNAGWPGGEMRRHWPFKSGYIASSNALALTVVSPVAAESSESVSPIAPTELRNRMRMSPEWGRSNCDVSLVGVHAACLRVSVPGILVLVLQREIITAGEGTPIGATPQS